MRRRSSAGQDSLSAAALKLYMTPHAFDLKEMLRVAVDQWLVVEPSIFTALANQHLSLSIMDYHRDAVSRWRACRAAVLQLYAVVRLRLGVPRDVSVLLARVLWREWKEWGK